MEFTPEELDGEAKRLHGRLGKLGWSMDACRLSAHLTLETNKLKKEKNAIILAHSYQTPDIIYGVADFTGDSYALSKRAAETKAGTIVFSGVRFMAETAKLLNPEKKVFIPSLDAGCSLADGITAEDVRKLRRENPICPVVCYVNTSAEVKAESDACCTSANAAKVLRSFKEKRIIFVPDEFMAKNLAKETGKTLVSWHARCVVHQDFDERKISAVKKQFPGIKVLAHSECPPLVAQSSDLVGGTADMERYVASSGASSFMLVTECGLSDRLRSESPEKEFVGMCALCPYMKKNSLLLILRVLKEQNKENEIKIPVSVAAKAKAALDRMFELA